MVISHQDAAEALSTIETAQHRSATLRGYERRSPYLILWGVLWAVGYGLSDFAPAHWFEVTSGGSLDFVGSCG